MTFRDFLVAGTVETIGFGIKHINVSGDLLLYVDMTLDFGPLNMKGYWTNVISVNLTGNQVGLKGNLALNGPNTLVNLLTREQFVNYVKTNGTLVTGAIIPSACQ